MKNYFFVFFILICFCTLESKAQNDSLIKSDRYYHHNYENDFFNNTDRYYTQGVYLEFVLPVLKKTLLAKTLIPLHSNSGKKIQNYYGISTERIGFTPRSIRHEGIYYGERPFAAVAYLTHSLVSICPDKTLRLTTRIDLGFMGPNLRGAQEQKGIHYALDNIQPQGWENQIENDYVVNYGLGVEKGLLITKHFEITGIAEMRAGTLFDDIGVGSMIRVGWMQPYFSNLGVTRNKLARRFQLYGYARGKIKAVGYNASMQGGMINHNSIYTIPASDIYRDVESVSFGIVVAYKRFSLEHSRTFISPEFKEGVCHGWGRVGVNYCF